MEKNTSKVKRKYSHLTMEEREEIAISLEMGLKQSKIALKLQRNSSAISREITRNKSSIGVGTENAFHELTNKVLGTQSYFYNPYHSWEKGTVENMIGIIRRFYSKKTDWEKNSQCDLNKTARYITNRPMKLLGFKTPYQVFVALAA